MTPEAQRIAIAEACPKMFKIWETAPDHKNVTWWFSPDAYQAQVDPLNDLNAMHEAEKLLADDEEKQYKYIATLVGKDWSESWAFTDAGKAIHATATQRAEAFLRTLGKWQR